MEAAQSNNVPIYVVSVNSIDIPSDEPNLHDRTLEMFGTGTGGKAFFDSNDFGAVFSQVQKDSSAYYVLGFTSNNPLKDGRFRRLKVQVNRPDLKLDFRSGYYAGRDFEHLNRADREQQLLHKWHAMQ